MTTPRSDVTWCYSARLQGVDAQGVDAQHVVLGAVHLKIVVTCNE